MPNYNIQGVVRGAATVANALFNSNQQGDLLIAQGGAPYTEATRTGGHFNAISAAGTPLVVIPTTLCILELYNLVGSGMVMEITDLFLFHLLGTAAYHAPSIWAEVVPFKSAAPALSAITINSQSGQTGYTPTATTRVVTGSATTVVSAGWRPFGTPGSGVISTATPAEAWSVPVDGKMLVPPGCSLAITCVDSLATASSVQVGAAWNERRDITVQAR